MNSLIRIKEALDKAESIVNNLDGAIAKRPDSTDSITDIAIDYRLEILDQLEVAQMLLNDLLESDRP